jgi:hypothetical protein
MAKQVKIRYKKFADVPHQLRPFVNSTVMGWENNVQYIEMSFDQFVIQNYFDATVMQVGFDVVKSVLKAYLKSIYTKIIHAISRQ